MLEATLEHWAKIPDAEPVMQMVPTKKYELLRCVAVENLAKGDYVLCEVGCVPNEDDIISRAEKLLQGVVACFWEGTVVRRPSSDTKIGMLNLSPQNEVRICRKGIVAKWPMYKGGPFAPQQEEAYRLEGYATLCPSLSYRKLGVH